MSAGRSTKERRDLAERETARAAAPTKSPASLRADEGAAAPDDVDDLDHSVRSGTHADPRDHERKHVQSVRRGLEGAPDALGAMARPRWGSRCLLRVRRPRAGGCAA